MKSHAQRLCAVQFQLFEWLRSEPTQAVIERKIKQKQERVRNANESELFKINDLTQNKYKIRRIRVKRSS